MSTPLLEKEIKAIAVFDSGKVKGMVRFQEDLREKNVIIQVKISGLKKKCNAWISCT